ncbi:PEP-CTERM sorting domain-containing protein [Teredinibacter haidensis]|uniref:PEP-CTERM sorting domain-containing protein n=1 Tax=Teredinibacter haidensis TaxID=2731755 RepID=UPI0009489D86|nr:PEP-CTERM sorting domain-containing protein [Teredinibacter haidensis]
MIIRLVLASVAFFSIAANATLISGELNVDNQHWVYISTDDSTQGDSISSGDNWGITDTFSHTLDAGTDYFLHIYAEDVGGIAGFLGNLFLDSSDHIFTNGTDTLLTNGTDWNVSTTGWSGYTTASTYGSNGVGPWGTQAAIDSSAQWIWSDDAHNHNETYFSVAINSVSSASVPEPSTLILLFIGIAGLGLSRARKA